MAFWSEVPIPHLFAWSIVDVFLTQGNVGSAQMNQPFVLHAYTSQIAIGAVINLYSY